MAQHEVRVSIPKQEVVNADLTIAIHSDGKKLGRIEVSKGSIDWWPAYNTANHFRLTWEKFDQLMRAHGNNRKA